MSDSPIWSDAVKWHDPLCPWKPPLYSQGGTGPVEEYPCVCNFIAKVRADQRAIDEKYYLNPCMGCGFDDFSTYVCDDCAKEWEEDYNDES